MRVEIDGGVDEFSPGTIHIWVHDPLPNVFEGALIKLEPDPGGRTFWTTPPDHFFGAERGDPESYPGEYGYPGDLLRAAQRFASDRTDKKTAEAEMTKVLEGWSRATNRGSELPR